MRRVMQASAALGLLATGYLLGSAQVFDVTAVQAQNAQEGAEPIELSDETRKKLRDAHQLLSSAGEDLSEAGRYQPAIKGVNAYAIFAGGLNAVEDLESGRGVDPVTFAGLYADQATDEIREHLAFDQEGRLTYKNKVVRMYPISRLKQLHARQITLTAEE